MRRALFTVLLLLLAPAAPAAADGPSARAKLTDCETAQQQQDRSATFSGDVRTVPGALRLQVKFVLQARAEDESRWAQVPAPGFNAWNTSAPGIGRYVYTKTVQNLLAPAEYRAVVHFRWLGAGGRTLLRTRRTTRVCRQPDLRPDLLPARLERTGDGYEATVANVGRSPAQGFAVTLVIAGEMHHLGFVDQLDGRDRVRVSGVAPACQPGEMVILHVDADDAVDEAEEDANSMAVTCPAARGA